MEIDTSKLTDEQITKLGEFIRNMEEENNKITKWWIMPNFDCFEKYDPSIGLNYFVEEQKDSYPRNRPPLKSDFNSKEEAEKWLKKYLEEEMMFCSSRDVLADLILGIDLLRSKLEKHELIADYEWEDCFKRFNESRKDGYLFKVTKRN